MSALEKLRKSVEKKGTNELTAIEFLLLFFVDDSAVYDRELAECQDKAAAELQQLRERVKALEAVEQAARKLHATFTRYQPDGNHSVELWWKPNSASTMAQRDEALDELAAALERDA